MAYVYKPGEIEQIEAQYQTGATLEALATQYDKSVASIRMKLVKRGSYVKGPDPKPKQNTRISAKDPQPQQSKTATKPKATTKSEVLQAHKRALDLVGLAPF